jgi:hypothetical protein
VFTKFSFFTNQHVFISSHDHGSQQSALLKETLVIYMNSKASRDLTVGDIMYLIELYFTNKHCSQFEIAVHLIYKTINNATAS